ncbi:hypothetical protein AWENTII_010072 [Aspergillus wentii]|nr:hypothetical protein MW887_008510 [Aspergillus wentii]
MPFPEDNNGSASKRSQINSSTASPSNATPPISSRDPADKKVSRASKVTDDDDDDDEQAELTPEEAAQMEDLAKRLKEASKMPSIELDDILDPSHPSNAKYFQKPTRQILRNQDGDSSSSYESTSSEGESDSDDDEEEEEEDDQDEDMADASNHAGPLPRVTAGQRPNIHRIEKNSDILGRLSAFLPKMKDANEELQKEIAAGRGKDLRLDEVDENDRGRVIEMNLGLGVLEETRSGDEDVSSDEDNDHKPAQESTTEQPQGPKDSNVLGKLMGKKEDDSEKPTIQELND